MKTRSMTKKTAITLLVAVITIALETVRAQISIKSPVTPWKYKTALIPNLNLSGIKIVDLRAIRESRSSLVTQAAYYANMPNHGAIPPGKTAAHPAVQPRTIDGVTYRMQTVPFSDEPVPNPASVGPSQTETSTDHKRVCTAVPSRQVRYIETVREYGMTPTLVPGMIFTAQSVLDGTYQQVNVNRAPFSLTTELVDYSKPLDQNKPFQAVSAPYNLSSINTAVANLQNALGSVGFPDRFFGETFTIHSTGSTKLDFKAKASADLGALAGIPADVSASSGFSNNSNLEYTQVAAVIENPFFSVSVAEKPWELVQGVPPGDAILLQTIVYGRLGIFKARSKTQSASLAANVSAAVDALSGGVTASAEFDSLFTSGSDETECQVTILGGPPNTGANALDSFDDFRASLHNASPTVAGGFGVPIAYVFRYLSDDAPVLIQGMADYGIVDCKPLSRLKVCGVVHVNFVDDFPPDEEIYGTIKMTVGNTTKTLFERTSSTFVKLSTNQGIAYPDGANANWNINISSGEEIQFDVTPEQLNGGEVKIDFAIKDKIEEGAEKFGATEKAKADGFVTYAPGQKSIQLRDVLTSEDKKKEIVYDLDEVGPGQGALRAYVRLRID